MTSILEVEQLDTLSSNASSTITIGGTNATTLNLGSNVTGGSMTNTPAFYINLNADQSATDNAVTKIQFNDSVIDTDSAFDTSTNYRFTVPSGKAGKYAIQATVWIKTASSNLLVRCQTYIYKNGSSISNTTTDFRTNNGFQKSSSIHSLVDLSAGDYLEIFAFGDSDNSSDVSFEGGTTYQTFFQGYRLIGA